MNCRKYKFLLILSACLMLSSSNSMCSEPGVVVTNESDILETNDNTAPVSVNTLWDLKPFKGDFNGFVVGLTGGYGYSRFNLQGNGFKSYYPKIGVLVGYGHVLSSNIYLGVEVQAYNNMFSSKRKANDGTLSRLSRSYDFEGSVRLGKVIRDNFLPYISLGMGYNKYKYRTPSFKTSFYEISFIPEIGVNAFVYPNFIIRSAFAMERTQKIKTKINLGRVKKHNSSILKIAFIYKF